MAPALLGCVLETDTAAGLVAVRLTEVEAYSGQTDPGLPRLPRQDRPQPVMFGPPGHAYVYFIYGMHFCVNLVCLPAGTAEAVLLRAGQVVDGAEVASDPARAAARTELQLARGRPGCARRWPSTAGSTVPTCVPRTRRYACAGRARVDAPAAGHDPERAPGRGDPGAPMFPGGSGSTAISRSPPTGAPSPGNGRERKRLPLRAAKVARIQP